MGHSSRTWKGEIRDALQPRTLKSLKEEETAGRACGVAGSMETK